MRKAGCASLSRPTDLISIKAHLPKTRWHKGRGWAVNGADGPAAILVQWCAVRTLRKTDFSCGHMGIGHLGCRRPRGRPLMRTDTQVPPPTTAFPPAFLQTVKNNDSLLIAA